MTPPRHIPLSWDQLTVLCRNLAVRVGRSYRPEIVVGVARAGTVPGALIALLLRIDFQSLRVPSGDQGSLRPHLPARESIAGRRVLLVDEVAPSGNALRWAAQALRYLGARDVRSLLLFSAPHGARADYTGPLVQAPVLQPWIPDVAIADAEIAGGDEPAGPADRRPQARVEEARAGRACGTPHAAAEPRDTLRWAIRSSPEAYRAPGGWPLRRSPATVLGNELC